MKRLDSILFQSTHPSWGATRTVLHSLSQRVQFQSTHPSWGATIEVYLIQYLTKISIHAPIVGCDNIDGSTFIGSKIFQSTHPSWGATSLFEFPHEFSDISIHAPIVGCDQYDNSRVIFSQKFQSTHPSWGATFRNYKHVPDALNFNPRTHRGVRRLYHLSMQFTFLFQSTHPSWGATVCCYRQ